MSILLVWMHVNIDFRNLELQTAAKTLVHSHPNDLDNSFDELSLCHVLPIYSKTRIQETSALNYFFTNSLAKGCARHVPECCDRVKKVLSCNSH